MSDNPDDRAILASIPAHLSSELDADLPLAVIPCLRLEGGSLPRKAGGVA